MGEQKGNDSLKKILFVISYLDKGGAERALSNITTHFPEEWDIDILVNDDRVIDYPFRGNIITLGISEKPRTGSILFQLKVLLKRVRRLIALKKTGQYTACVSFLDSANIANIISGKGSCKVIASVRSGLRQQERFPQYKYVVNPMVRFFYNRATKVVAVSEGIRRELIERFHLCPNKVVVIENGFSLLEIQKQAQEMQSEKEINLIHDRRVVVTTGRLEEPKGQWHLIRAFAEVAKKIPDAVLLIIGSGELESYLKKLVKDSGIENCVFFTGFVTNPYKYMSRAELFVFPSLYEGFPNALAEAICLELPCIATDFQTGAREILSPAMCKMSGSVNEIVEAEYGMLTPLCSGEKYGAQGDPLEYQEKCLAEAIILLLTDEVKRKKYADASRKRKKSLTIDSAIDKWIDLIE